MTSEQRNPWDDARKLEAMSAEIRAIGKYYGHRLYSRHAVAVLEIARLEVDYAVAKLGAIALSTPLTEKVDGGL